MLVLIAIWALAEATLFFIVADVPIMALGIKAGWKKALGGAVLAALFAAIGGVALCVWGGQNPGKAYQWMLAIPAVDAALIEQVDAGLEEYGLLGMAIGSFTGVPYKLYAFAASSYPQGFGNLTLFFAASIIARLPRFALVALIAGWAGPRLAERLGKRTVWSIFAGFWVAFYAWYWSVMGF